MTMLNWLDTSSRLGSSLAITLLLELCALVGLGGLGRAHSYNSSLIEQNVFVGLGGFGRAHNYTPVLIEQLFVGLGSLGYAHTSVLTLRFTGDSNSPMPSPVGGILDTPIVTFHSRIPEDLSLRIDDTLYSRDDTFLTLSARCPGPRLQIDEAPFWTNSNWLRFLSHGRRRVKTPVIDKLILTKLLTPMWFKYPFLSLFLHIQVKLGSENKRIFVNV